MKSWIIKILAVVVVLLLPLVAQASPIEGEAACNAACNESNEECMAGCWIGDLACRGTCRHEYMNCSEDCWQNCSYWTCQG